MQGVWLQWRSIHGGLHPAASVDSAFRGRPDSCRNPSCGRSRLRAAGASRVAAPQRPLGGPALLALAPPLVIPLAWGPTGQAASPRPPPRPLRAAREGPRGPQGSPHRRAGPAPGGPNSSPGASRAQKTTSPCSGQAGPLVVGAKGAKNVNLLSHDTVSWKVDCQIQSSSVFAPRAGSRGGGRGQGRPTH